MIFTEYLSNMAVYKIEPFLKWSVGASYHGNSFKTPGQGRFTYIFSLLSNGRPYFG